MKKFILYAMSFVPMLLWGQESKFVLKGKIGDRSSPFKIYLLKGETISPDNILDSALLKNGSFEFNGRLDIARLTGLVIAADRSALIQQRGKASGPAPVRARAVPEYKYFYLDAGETVVTSADSLRHATISGASEKVNGENEALWKYLEPVRSRNGEIGQLQMNTPEETQKTEAYKKEMNAMIEAVDKEQAATVGKFIKEHPNSPISLYALAGNMGAQATLPQLKELYAILLPAIRNSKAGKSFAAGLVRMEKTAIGSPAPDFTEKDTNGKPVRLSDFRGKYVLLDFWASWCGPCRKENPNVVKAYNKYKDRNFTIISVSLDQTKAPWLAAIEKDGLYWTHVSDLKGFDDAAATLYEVHAIPVNYLIDPDGKIIATRLRDVALDEKLASVLATSTLQAGEYSIKGTVSEKYDAPLQVYLRAANSKVPADSAILHKGHFEFKGKLSEPLQMSLVLQHDVMPGTKKQRQDAKQIWVDEGEITVTGGDNISEATITGSLLTDEQHELDQSLKSYNVQQQLFMDTMINNYNKDPREADRKYDEQMRSILPQRKKIVYAFIKNHPNSYLSVLSLGEMLTSNPDISEVGPLYAVLSDKQKATSKGKEAGEIISHLNVVGIGAQAPLFAQKTPDGKTIGLADFKGKYVLIDFWASWCVPCRAENPDVVKAFNAFKDKGFTVLGVSLDEEKTRKAWTDAIAKDNLGWAQVCDMKGWQNEAATLYGVRAIPANFLVDPKGVIVAKNLHGAELAETLSKLFNH